MDTNLENSSAAALMAMKMSSWPVSASPTRPQRKRKKNRLIFNDNEVVLNDSGVWGKKAKKVVSTKPESPSTSAIIRKPLISSINSESPSTSKENIGHVEKATAKRVGARLRNLLKLPKAHKMCMFEWFYSHLDQPLFSGENDFCICLKESFPELSTKMLTRAHWVKIRRLMGKPRRCSEAFFKEERTALEMKRSRLRQLQQRKIACDDPDAFADLPREVPMPLVIGTNVTARVRGSHDGLFTGQIDAIDINNALYRVTFDRPNLGTHLVADVEVASCEPQETINLMSLVERKPHGPNRLFSNFIEPRRHDLDSSLQSPPNEHDPVLGRSPMRSKLMISSSNEHGGTLGGFPVQFLKSIARLSRILSIKREKVSKLSEMNSQAEKANSYGEQLTLEFQKQYATIVLDLERLNKDLNELLVGVQRFCIELYPEQALPNDQSSRHKQQCMETAEKLVAEKNITEEDEGNSRPAVKSVGLTNLIVQLTSLMMQVKFLKENNGTPIEYKSLTDTMKDIKQNLSSENSESFQNNVEIHIAHIRSGMENNGLYNSSLTSKDA